MKILASRQFITSGSFALHAVGLRPTSRARDSTVLLELIVITDDYIIIHLSIAFEHKKNGKQ